MVEKGKVTCILASREQLADSKWIKNCTLLHLLQLCNVFNVYLLSTKCDLCNLQPKLYNVLHNATESLLTYLNFYKTSF